MYNTFMSTLSQSTPSEQRLINWPYKILIDKNFMPADQLPDGVVFARRVLFGSSPDPLMKAYRTIEAYRVLSMHPELKNYLELVDPNRTHLSEMYEAFHNGDPAVDIITGTRDPQVTVLENADSSVSGKMEYDLTVKLTGEGQVTVTVSKPIQKTSVISVETVTGMTKPFSIPGTYLQARIPTTADYACRIQGFIAPRMRWPQIISSCKSQNEEAIADLFLLYRPESDRRYLAQLYRWWAKDRSSISDKVASLSAAICERTLIG